METHNLVRVSFVLAGAALFGCSAEADYCVGPTCIMIQESAVPWQDMFEFLPNMQEVTKDVYGEAISNDVFQVELELFPGSYHLVMETTQGEIQVECGALWARPVVRATVVGKTTLEGCLPHEFWQHRLPHALGFGWNDDHTSFWRKLDLQMQARAAERSAEEPPTYFLQQNTGNLIARDIHPEHTAAMPNISK